MSFQPPTIKQENQNRKILEELQKKQQALKQLPNPITSLPSSSNLPIKPGANILKPQIISPSGFNVNQFDFNHHLSNPNMFYSNGGHQREKVALQYALQNSFGNYVSQDSSFGNQVVPVLPLFN